MSTARLVVFGSLNIDHVWRVRRLPGAGETVMCVAASQVFGGKGANQAVAASRAGGEVTLIGAVGADEAGEGYLAHLALAEKLTMACVCVERGFATGSAHVYVADDGENQIVVHGGANDWWTADRVRVALPPVLEGSARLILPAEMPLGAVVQALVEARRLRVPVLFNASPIMPNFPWGRVEIDTVVINEHECAELFGRPPAEFAALSQCVRRDGLETRGIMHLVVTCGARSTWWFSAEDVVSVPAHRVTPVDTVGAGDTFAGVLAVGLVEGLAYPEAIARGNIAGALSTLEAGAQPAIPKRDQIDTILCDRQPVDFTEKV